KLRRIAIMTKSIFEKIILDTNADKAFHYAHSSEYAKKREESLKVKLTSSIRKKKVKLKNLLG
ncbi:MAG: hypothetical protein U9O24_01865, partial [Campylobacterota bacterium]|nr:hypothetical protein [Campylobacterota bacterium]